MKIKLQTMLKHKLQWLLLLAALLGVSQVSISQTQTYYVYGGTTGHADSDLTGSEWKNPKVTVVGDNNTFTFNLDLSGNTVNREYYYGICRSSQKFLPNGGASNSNDWNDHIAIKKDINVSTSGVTVFSQANYVSSCEYYFFGVKKTVSDVSSVTITITKISNENISSCSKNQNPWNIFLSGESVDSWYLCGEFTEWDQHPINFVKNGNNYVAYIDLPANHTYRKDTNNEGFKIKKNENTWYGITNTLITSANAATSKGFSEDNNVTHNCGIETTLAGTYVFSFTLSYGNPQLTVTYPTKQPTAPVVRWGNRPSINSYNIKTSEYIAAQGCDGASHQTVTKMRVKFWKDGEQNASKVIESEEGTYTIGSVYDDAITIPYTNEILKSCTTATKIYMEVAGLNSTGWSDYSDRVSILYTASNTFETHDPDLYFTACEGVHEFTLTDMVLPEPDYKFVTIAQTAPTSVADAKSHFTENNGVLIWSIDGRATGVYKYDFTFTKTKDGLTYTSKTQEVTINYTAATAPIPATDYITDIVAVPAIDLNNPINPYAKIELSTTKKGGITDVDWYVKTDKTRVILTVNEENHTQATFSAKPRTDERTYTVYVKGLTASCGATEEKSIQIKVKPSSEDCSSN